MPKNLSKLLEYRSELIFLVTFVIFLVPVGFVFAQGGGGLVPCEGAECGLCDFVELIKRVLNFIITLSTAVAGVLFAYAGILYMSSPANVDNIKQAHSIFFNVVVGLFVILAAWLIINAVMMALVKNTYLPWQEVCINSLLFV